MLDTSATPLRVLPVSLALAALLIVGAGCPAAPQSSAGETPPARPKGDGPAPGTASQPAPVSPAPPETRPADLPTLDGILARATEALGGREAMAKVESIHTKASARGAELPTTIETWWMRTGQWLLETKQGANQNTVGFDGKVGWRSKIGGGWVALSEQEIEMTQPQVSQQGRLLDLAETYKKDYGTVEVVERATFGGHECFKVHVVSKKPGEEGYHYFDVETGLPVGWQATRVTQFGSMASETVLSDWKVIEGVKFCHKIDISAMGRSVGLDFEPIEVNCVDPTTITAPADLTVRAPRPATETGLTPEQQGQADQLLAQLKALPPDQLEERIDVLSSVLGMAPAEERKVFEYVIAEAKKELAKKREAGPPLPEGEGEGGGAGGSEGESPE